MHKKRRFGTRFRETVITNAVLTQNDAKRILHQKHRIGTTFRERVETNPVLTQIGAKRTLHYKRRFGTRFRETQFEHKTMRNPLCTKTPFWHSI